jgi:uncharacterized membrane protein YraQ (UPF0718 family)
MTRIRRQLMQSFLGAVVLLVALWLFLAPLLTTRDRRPVLHITRAARRGLTVALTVIAALVSLPAIFAPLRQGLFSFCATCPVTGPAGESWATAAEWLGAFLLAVWHYAGTVLPVFVLASALSGLVIARVGRLPVRGFLGSFAVASLVPVCSCGVVPLARALLQRGGSSARDGVVLLIAAPLLSPVIIFLGLTVLGPHYLAVRVAAALATAGVAVLVVTPLLRSAKSDSQVRDDAHNEQTGGGDSQRGRADATKGISSTAKTGSGAPRESALDAGWSTLTSLSRYVLLGVVIGAVAAVTVPSGAVETALSAGPLATAAIVVAGVPINMCAGEEILVAAPFVGAGLTMGQAIAFALAGAGVCLGCIPLFVAVIGRRATLAVVALYLVAPLIIGLLLDLGPALPLGAGQLPGAGG